MKDSKKDLLQSIVNNEVVSISHALVERKLTNDDLPLHTLVESPIKAVTASIIGILVDNGIDINGKDESGNTPIVALLLAHPNIDQLVQNILFSLLAHGASPTIPNLYGDTAITLLARTAKYVDQCLTKCRELNGRKVIKTEILK